MRTNTIASGIVVIACLIGSATARATAPPDYFVEPAKVHIDTEHLSYETFGEVEFPAKDGEDPVLKQGHHFNFSMKVALPDSTTFQQTWQVIGPSLAQQGWTTLLPGNGFYTIRYQKNGKDTWGVIGIFGPDDIRVDIVEVAPVPAGFSVPLPSIQTEPATPAGADFKVAPPLPGAERTGSDHFPDPMLVSLPNDEQPEQVASGYTTKNYHGPQMLSNLEIISRYEKALTASGWTVAVKIEGPHSSDGVLITHYARGERNLWLALHSSGNDYSLQLSDEAAPNKIANDLQRSCHAVLTGVLFDFNKATLKPESTPVLQQVLALSQASPTLKLEIQGHTDNVGSDDYNLTLSRARAAAVKDWLTAHGANAALLSANGYGKGRPIASNDDDTGRARNRRVEVARLNCTSAH